MSELFSRIIAMPKYDFQCAVSRDTVDFRFPYIASRLTSQPSSSDLYLFIPFSFLPILPGKHTDPLRRQKRIC
jgi:hypothetical protein